MTGSMELSLGDWLALLIPLALCYACIFIGLNRDLKRKAEAERVLREVGE